MSPRALDRHPVGGQVATPVPRLISLRTPLWGRRSPIHLSMPKCHSNATVKRQNVSANKAGAAPGEAGQARMAQIRNCFARSRVDALLQLTRVTIARVGRSRNSANSANLEACYRRSLRQGVSGPLIVDYEWLASRTTDERARMVDPSPRTHGAPLDSSGIPARAAASNTGSVLRRVTLRFLRTERSSQFRMA